MSEILIIIGLILLNGVFSMSEVAMIFSSVHGCEEGEQGGTESFGPVW